MKAIITTVLPATETKPTRIKASDQDGNSIVISRHTSDGNMEDAHRQAAHDLARKMSWSGRLVSGHIKNGMAHVFDTK